LRPDPVALNVNIMVVRQLPMILTSAMIG